MFHTSRPSSLLGKVRSLCLWLDKHSKRSLGIPMHSPECNHDIKHRKKKEEWRAFLLSGYTEVRRYW